MNDHSCIRRSSVIPTVPFTVSSMDHRDPVLSITNTVATRRRGFASALSSESNFVFSGASVCPSPTLVASRAPDPTPFTNARHRSRRATHTGSSSGSPVNVSSCRAKRRSISRAEHREDADDPSRGVSFSRSGASRRVSSSALGDRSYRSARLFRSYSILLCWKASNTAGVHIARTRLMSFAAYARSTSSRPTAASLENASASKPGSIAAATAGAEAHLARVARKA